MKLHIAVIFAVLVAMGCKDRAAEQSSGDKPVVVATTTMLGDLATQIGGDDIVVEAIMKPGGDPHLYQPTPGDARRVASSQLVVTSGLHLEGWIDDLVRNAGGERPVVVASTPIEPIRMESSPGGVDPHFWFDLTAWQQAADEVGAAMQKLVAEDASAKQRIADRLAAHKHELRALDEWTKGQLASIPKEHRVLITSHDAFNYFGRAYQIDVVGIQGISTEQEAAQRDVANVIDIVRERGAPAVFVETSVNPQLIQQVARETGVKVAGPLYSDSIGPKGGPAETFIGTVAENVRIVTEALGGQYIAFQTPAPKASERM